MDFFKWIRRLKLSPLRSLQLYPPFLFMGARVRLLSPDYHRVEISIPQRWYGTNMNGSLFGGFICAVADPVPALMCGWILKNVEYWTKANYVDFISPGRGRIFADIVITESEITTLRTALAQNGKATHVVEFQFHDSAGTIVAKVRNTIYVRKKSGAGSV